MNAQQDFFRKQRNSSSSSEPDHQAYYMSRISNIKTQLAKKTGKLKPIYPGSYFRSRNS